MTAGTGARHTLSVLEMGISLNELGHIRGQVPIILSAHLTEPN